MVKATKIIQISASLLVFISLITSNSLRAQERLTDTVRLQEIIVTGSPVKVTRNNVPLAVSVIGRSKIEETGESALLPVLSGRVPGLFVTERGITGFGVAAGSAGQITMRGIGGNPTTGVLVLIDGHPQFMGIMGHPLSDTYVSSDVEKVEVIRGPASILYGSNAMGGVINIITKKQVLEGFQGNAQLSYGSYNTQKYMASGGFKKKQFSAYLSGNHDQTEGHRENSDFSINNGYLKLAFEPNAHFYATADLNLAGFRASDPGPDTLKAIPGQKIDIVRGYVSIAIQHDFNYLSGSAKVFYNFGDHDITDGFHSSDHNYGTNLSESLKLTKTTTLSAGLDIMNYGGLAENVKAMGGKGIVFADTNMVETGIYGFAQQKILKKITLNSGLRYQHHTIYGGIWIPSGGFAWQLSKRTSWKGSISKGFRSPTIRELFLWGPNPSLLPEKIMNYETGISYTIPGKKAGVEATVFSIRGDNLIVNVPLKGLRNSGEIANNGVELSGEVQLSEKMMINGSYSYIGMKNPLYATPEHQLFLSTQYRFKKILLTGTIQQVINLDTDPSPVLTKESYLLAKARISCIFNKYLQVFINGDNLLNRNYEVNRYYTMPGITLFAGINIIF